MITTTGKTIQLPGEIAEQWNISHCLSIKNKSEVYLLESTVHKEAGILKVYYKNSFSKNKYKKLSLLSDKNLILPEKHYCISGVHYVLYSKFPTLKDILSHNGISLWELLSLGIDLSDAAITLHRHHIYEADISPNNIYQNKEGNFCLGDINIQTIYHKGTPGYIPPELSSTKQKPPSKEIFDKAMQYSICKLLDSIYQLNETIKTESISHLLEKGMKEKPDSRFRSLNALREELREQQKELETDHCYQVFQIKETNHILFRVRTVTSPSKDKILLYPVLWCILVLAGCFFLVVLYRYLHPDNHLSQNGIYLSQVAESTFTDFMKESPSPASTKTAPTATSTTTAVNTFTAVPETETTNSKQETELDYQNKGLTSLSEIVSQTVYPEKAVCLYAGKNRLTDTSSVHRFSEIRELYLDSNQIQNLSHISALKNLEILVLSYNQITDIPDLSGLVSLKHLDISSNPDFKDITSLKKLTNLTTLNITGTGISKKQYLTLCRELTKCKIIY